MPPDSVVAPAVCGFEWAPLIHGMTVALMGVGAYLSAYAVKIGRENRTILRNGKDAGDVV